MTVYKALYPLNYLDLPIGRLFTTEANQSWIDGECPDRYAGSLLIWDSESKRFTRWTTIHEDTMATIGFHDDASWPVKNGYCKPGDITHHASVEAVPINELPREAFTYMFQQETARAEAEIKAIINNRKSTPNKHFVKTSHIINQLNTSYIKQFKQLGINIKALAIKLIKKHNSTIAKIRANKRANHNKTANTIANLCPELKTLKH